MTEFTTKQIAELLDVSKPTVQKAINKLSITPERKENNNKAYYNYTDTVSVIKEIRPNFDFSTIGAKPQSKTEKPQNEAQNSDNQTAKPQSETAKPQNEEIELLRSMLEIIQEQLKEKDRQLAVKDKQIQDLSDRLAEAIQLTKGQQYIAAADKTTELLEADTKKRVQQPQPQKQKKSFWRRLFER